MQTKDAIKEESLSEEQSAMNLTNRNYAIQLDLVSESENHDYPSIADIVKPNYILHPLDLSNLNHNLAATLIESPRNHESAVNLG